MSANFGVSPGFDEFEEELEELLENLSNIAPVEIIHIFPNVLPQQAPSNRRNAMGLPVYKLRSYQREPNAYRIRSGCTASSLSQRSSHGYADARAICSDSYPYSNAFSPTCCGEPRPAVYICSWWATLPPSRKPSLEYANVPCSPFPLRNLHNAILTRQFAILHRLMLVLMPFLNSIQTFFPTMTIGDPQNEDCPICLESLQEHVCVQMKGVGSCRHVFGSRVHPSIFGTRCVR